MICSSAGDINIIAADDSNIVVEKRGLSSESDYAFGVRVLYTRYMFK